MKEFIEARTMAGNIRITMKGKEPWIAVKADVCRNIVDTVQRFQAQRYKLTLRQLYYQLVAADVIPNHMKVYKKIGALLNDLRYSGIIDWDAIEDRGRSVDRPFSVDNIGDAMRIIARSYALDRQKDQNTIVEVWTEKDAISGILSRICRRYHVPLVVNKGYSSASAMHKAYERFAGYITQEKKVHILYFGDHDPSGLDMIRDIRVRIETFLTRGTQVSSVVWDDWQSEGPGASDWELVELAEGEGDDKAVKILESNNQDSDTYWDVYDQYRNLFELRRNEAFTVEPIGLTMEQIAMYNPPPNPAKTTDSRAAEYIAEHGSVSWEVDALEPRVMERIVETAICGLIDLDQYDTIVDREEVERDTILQIASRYSTDEEE